MQPDPQTPAAGQAGQAGLLDRVKSILVSPRSEWPVIAGEPATVAGLYTGYIMILAAIPAVFGFIKGSLIGHGAFGVTFTTPIFAGLVGMVLGYVLGLVVLYLVALLVNALAPTFGGQKSQVQALKAVGYAWTAAWVAGIAVIVPWLGWLITLAGAVYSIYLLYLGLPHTMKCPQEKSLAYTAVTVVITIVLSLIIGMVVAGITGLGALATGALGGGGGSSSSDNVRVDSSSRIGQLAELGKRMEEAGRQVEQQVAQAKASGDPDAVGNVAGNALGTMMGALGGSSSGEPVEALAPDALRGLLPESIGNMRRTSISGSANSAMGVQMSEASAQYASEDGSASINVEIKDMAGLSGMMAMAGAFGMEQSSERVTDSGFERSYSRDGRLIKEQWDSNSMRGSYSSTVANRFEIEARGRAGSFDDLKEIVERLDRQVTALQ